MHAKGELRFCKSSLPSIGERLRLINRCFAVCPQCAEAMETGACVLGEVRREEELD